MQYTLQRYALYSRKRKLKFAKFELGLVIAVENRCKKFHLIS